MSKVLPPKPRSMNQKGSITIVASLYNEEFTNSMVKSATEELQELVPNAQIDVIRVPGAFEVPVVVESVIRQEAPHCVIALGLIIRGQTAHGDMVAESVTYSLQQIAVNHAVPIIHEVLIVADEKQAYARCIEAKLNRGKEAARAATTMLDTLQQLKRSTNRVFPSNA